MVTTKLTSGHPDFIQQIVTTLLYALADISRITYKNDRRKWYLHGYSVAALPVFNVASCLL
jgi:hypothetical protein